MPHSTVDWLASRLERLGYRGYLEPVAATAACVIFKVGNPPVTLSARHLSVVMGRKRRQARVHRKALALLLCGR